MEAAVELQGHFGEPGPKLLVEVSLLSLEAMCELPLRLGEAGLEHRAVETCTGLVSGEIQMLVGELKFAEPK